VHVIVLHGKMQETEARWVTPSGASQREPDRRIHMLTAQWGEPRTQRHVNGLVRLLLRPSPMRHIPALRPLPPRPNPRPAPREWKREWELLLAPP
jgi:hypothetical protein